MTTWVRYDDGFDSEGLDARGTRRGGDRRRARELLRFASANLLMPLDTIKTLAEVYKQDDADSVPADAASMAVVLERIAGLAGETARLVQDVLAVERLAQQEAVLGSRGDGSLDVDVEDAISDAVLLQRDALMRARCAIVVTRSADANRLRGPWRRESLVRMFSHLFYNASWRATGLPATVDLTLQHRWLRVLFSDGGALGGSDTVGDSFWRLARAQQGNGLGLWILNQTVADLGGEMEVQTHAQRGASFDIRLPR